MERKMSLPYLRSPSSYQNALPQGDIPEISRTQNQRLRMGYHTVESSFSGRTPIARSIILLTVLFALTASAPHARADEGLWLWNQFPAEVLKQKHEFEVKPGFLDDLRLASVRLGAESGSFVSSAGLILTTRQAVSGCLASASLQGRDLMQNGFTAADNASEPRCPGLDASILLSLEDVTAKIKADNQSLAQRNAAIAKAEKDCAAKTGNVCAVVRLFAGGRYDLYQYKRYSDVRLVFAPEYSVALFGKERDAITYLRYGLNAAFVRAYENGKPADTPHYLKWSAQGVKDGELVFASGNPGPTSRSVTAAQLTFYRDTALPLAVARGQVRIQALNALGPAGQAALTPLLNAFKTDAGKLIGLRDDRLVTRKTTFEQKIRRAVEADSKLGADAAKVWDEVASAYRKWAPFEMRYQILESPAAPGSRLFAIARQIVRGEPVDTSPDPFNDAVETLMLTQYLEDLRAADDKEIPLKAILAGKPPKQVATEMVQATKLKDVSGRRMTREAALKSDDPVVHLAVLLDPQALRVRKQHDEIIGALEVSAAEKIAQYRLKLFGAADYPDGTSTPRISFGVVNGYTDRAAVAQPFAATFSGLYYRTNNSGPWQVPQNWVDIRPRLNPVTPLDFVSTCDIGGGGFGSPVVNRVGELVGVTFDGNLESLPNVYLYTSDQARAVNVDVRGIAEALAKVYKATGLLRELGLETALGLT
jgi:Peptidase S46